MKKPCGQLSFTLNGYRYTPDKVNTLILGPGGYSFGDYWRMGLPLEIIVVAVSIPAILVFWPL
jgi:di/tricarboxylate transporter